MARKRTSELIRCQYFCWLLKQRNGVFQADGRRNSPSLGRHSLGTRDHATALESLAALDATMAVECGLAPAPAQFESAISLLSLSEGTDEYLAFVARPRSLKGTKASTQKTYRGVFAKAIPFFERRGIHHWNDISERELEAFAAWMEKNDYAHATQVKEVVTLKQALNHWIERGMLPAGQQFTLDIDKVSESTTYCFTGEQVAAMVKLCRADEKLVWLADVLVGLAYTGLRISELAALRWSAISFDRNMLTIVDDSRSHMRRRIYRSTKNSRSRSIPIHDELRDILERLRLRDQHGFVFRAQRGGMLRPRNVLNSFIVNVIEPLQNSFPHEDPDDGFGAGRIRSMRHYFCSWCANSGVPETVLMKWLGHSCSLMVRRYYHLHDTEAQTQMRKLGNLDMSGGT